MADAGMDQSALARAAGCTAGAVNQIVAGNVERSRFLPEIASALHVSLRWLRGENVPRDIEVVPAQPQAADVELDLVPIAMIDLEYGMGGSFTDVPVEVEVQHFPRMWIETITHSPPELLTFARGRGDSMSPTINHGDLVLIDRSQRVVEEQDAFWALTVGEIGMIKRLRIRRGVVQIHSDNERVEPDEADVGEVNIVGRIVFIGRRV